MRALYSYDRSKKVKIQINEINENGGGKQQIGASVLQSFNLSTGDLHAGSLCLAEIREALQFRM